MEKRVLIVGNGISRLKFDNEIKSYQGEIWACNYGFRDFPEIITRLTGHNEPLNEAQIWKEEKGYKFEIYAGPMARKNPEWKAFTCPPKWHRDSGSTLVVQALFEGFSIDLVGFDLGGADIHSPGHEKVDKTNWVHRWVEIAKEFGLDKVNFWGHDHREFIFQCFENPHKAKEYANAYRSRKPHIKDADYQECFKGFFMPKEKEIEKLVEIVYPNGYKATVKESIGTILVCKGAAVLVGDAPEKKALPEIKKRASK